MRKSLFVKSEFSRNVITLMTGTTIAQAVPIMISPILTRIYTPKDFGVFAIFFALTTIFGSIANARYELAIMLPHDDEDAINIVALGILIALVLSVILLIVTLGFNSKIASLLGNTDIANWLYLVPLSVLFVGIFNVLTYFNSRKKYYDDIRNSTIIKSIILSLIQIFVGLIKPGAAGLILGEVGSRIFSNTRLSKNIICDRKLLSSINQKKMIQVARQYSDFPKYSVWAISFNNLSNKSLDLSISTIYSVSILGLYSLTDKVLGAPIALIGKSIGQVYFQHASDEYKKTGKVRKSFMSTFKRTLILSTFFFGILFFIIEPIFVLVFGKAWHQAGILAKYMIFLYFCRFIASPLTLTPIILNKNKVDLVFQFIMLLISIMTIFMGIIFSLKLLNFLFILSTTLGIFYLIYILYIYLKLIR